MHRAATLISLLTILATLWEAYETVILPRRIQRKLRFTRYFYLATWAPWRTLTERVSKMQWRETLLSFYGRI